MKESVGIAFLIRTAVDVLRQEGRQKRVRWPSQGLQGRIGLSVGDIYDSWVARIILIWSLTANAINDLMDVVSKA